MFCPFATEQEMTFEVVFTRDDGTIEGRSIFFPKPFQTKQNALNAILLDTRISKLHYTYLQIQQVKRKK
jgi:hypothetical protein